MNSNYRLLVVLLIFVAGSINAQQTAETQEYPTPPSVKQDINSVDLLSGRYIPEVPELSIPAAPRLSFKFLQQFVVYVESSAYFSGDVTNYDFTYQGNTSERIKCDITGCTPTENYGSTMIGGVLGGSVQYRQGQTGIRYIYSNKEYSGSTGVAEVERLWIGQILYPDGETLEFEYEYGPVTNSSYYSKPHRPLKVTSNTGYEIRFTYASSDWTNSPVEWYQLATAAIYETDESSALVEFKYDIVGDVTTVTDQKLTQRKWQYSGFTNKAALLPAAATTFSLALPGNSLTTDASVSTSSYLTAVPAQGLIKNVTRNGLSYEYVYEGAASNGSSKIFDKLTISGQDGSDYQRILHYEQWGDGHAKQQYVERESNSEGMETSYTYYPIKRRIDTITFPEGNKVSYKYDEKGNVTEKRARSKTPNTPSDIVVTATYPDSTDPDCPIGGPYGVRCFKPITVTDAKGKITEYEFAAHGGLIEKTGPESADGFRVTRNKWERGYAQGQNPPDEPTGLWRLDKTTECTVEDRSHECSSSSLEVLITEYSYWKETNLPQCVTTRSSASNTSSPDNCAYDSTRSTVTYGYDDAGRVLYMDGPLLGLGDAVYYRYDASGRKTWEIGAEHKAWNSGSNNYVYRRIAKEFELRAQDSQPSTISTGWITSPVAENPSLNVDSIESITYTDHGLAKMFKTKVGGTIYQLKQIKYDSRNRVDCEVQRMNPANFSNPNEDACSLDETGNPSDFGPDRIRQFEYDKESRTTKVTSGLETADEGVDMKTTYTDNGQVWQRFDGNNKKTTYYYDAHDRLDKVEYPDQSFELFDFDANGNKTSWQKRDGEDFIYTYDVMNQLEMTSVPDEPEPGIVNTILHEYDGVGRPKKVSRGTGNMTEYVYDKRGYLNSSKTNGNEVTYINDAAGRVTSMTYPQNQVVSYGYDSSNAVTSVDIKQTLSSSAHSVADYVYDNMGRLTDVLLGDNSLTTYQYDDIGRLERHTLADFHITTLGYNPASQIVRRSVTDRTMQAAMPDSSPDLYTPNYLNQYTSVDANNSLYYDNNGNLTKYDGWDYGYDAHNRLELATGPGTLLLNLAYDPTGRLSSTTLQNSTTSFSYSGDQLIGEYNSTGNQTNLYVYAPGSDIPIARFSGGSIGPSNVAYLRADERGSIVLETDGTTVLESHQYDVYGVPLNVSDSLFRYTGQIQLKGTELYHYKARAYHPELGRFLQTDPIGYDDGMNMYAYVGNDPVNGVDPDGRKLVYNGSATDVSAAKTHMATVVADSRAGAAGINQLHTSSNVHTVNAGPTPTGGNETIPSGSGGFVTSGGANDSGTGTTINFDPGKATGGVDDAGSSVRNPAIGLGHEVGHAVDLDSGSHPQISSPTYQRDSSGNLVKPQTPNHETGSSMKIENEMRAADPKFDLRSNYVQ